MVLQLWKRRNLPLRSNNDHIVRPIKVEKPYQIPTEFGLGTYACIAYPGGTPAVFITHSE
jgi:hypothetical protein